MQTDFSVQIPQAEHVKDQYFSLADQQEYSIRLFNNLDRRADAEIKIDGMSIGKFRVNARSNVTIERPAGVDRRFVFTRENGAFAERAGVREAEENGLIEVTFSPEFVLPKGLIAEGPSSNRLVAQSSYSSGATALGAKSDQRFTSVEALPAIDHYKVSTVRLRLVVREDAPKALRSYPEAVLRNQPAPPRWPGY